jgi:hypothetical protein
MGQRGLKRLSAAQLKARGANKQLIKRREAEERAQRQPVVYLKPGRALPEPPAGLEQPVAQAFWQRTVEGYQFDHQSLTLLAQACYSLARAEQARERLDLEGMTVTDRTGKMQPHSCIKIELEHRQLFVRICKELGFLAVD